VLDCVSIFDTAVKPETGDHVIVEAIRADGLRELTVKEYREEDGKMWLVPRSTKQGFEPVAYPGPNTEHANDSKVQVIAFVVGSVPPRVLSLLRRMGMVKHP
jgi:hypothetical protein